MVYLGCIADDFTGATDLAGLLARSGIRVNLRIGVPAISDPNSESFEQTSPFEVIALKIRSVPRDEAVREARAAYTWLRSAGAERFYWKYCSTFDSTSEGNIGPVAEALLSDTGASQTVYCPAFPENGRTVYMGNLFVGRQLLEESPMKDHPITPMKDSNLERLLSAQITGTVGLVDRTVVARGVNAITNAMEALQKNGVSHVIVDAITNADLETIASACQNWPLLTGGSALALPLPALYLRQLKAQDLADRFSPPQTDTCAVILSGSCSAMTQKQIAHYTASGVPSFRLDPIKIARDGTGAALQWLKMQNLNAAPLLYTTAESDQVRFAQEKLGSDHAGKIVESAMATIALEAYKLGTRRFVIAGGETAGAVTKALAVSQLEIGPEIVPGVPWTFCNLEGHQCALALKSGNFGAERFFSDAIKMLNTMQEGA